MYLLRVSEDTVFSGAFTSTEAMKLRLGQGQTKAESRRSRDKDTSLEVRRVLG